MLGLEFQRLHRRWLQGETVQHLLVTRECHFLRVLLDTIGVHAIRSPVLVNAQSDRDLFFGLA